MLARGAGERSREMPDHYIGTLTITAGDAIATTDKYPSDAEVATALGVEAWELDAPCRRFPLVADPADHTYRFRTNGGSSIGEVARTSGWWPNLKFELRCAAPEADRA